mmetsp:Transcript_11543/g.17571  ORF Transcript_11543/g.17571 Transcript_11543/m.17571 type:complete len:124 (-) Transcript_11543:395-766(-)
MLGEETKLNCNGADGEGGRVSGGGKDMSDTGAELAHKPVWSRDDGVGKGVTSPEDDTLDTIQEEVTEAPLGGGMSPSSLSLVLSNAFVAGITSGSSLHTVSDVETISDDAVLLPLQLAKGLLC